MQTQNRKIDAGSDITRQPAMFIGHGSPMVAIEFDAWNENICNFIDNIPKPSGIVIVSAHWMTGSTTKITASTMPNQIYDFKREDYPETLFQLTYPVEGDPKLADQIKRLLNKRGHKAELTEERGLDHGAWVPMYVAFPNMDVPIVQVSIPDKGPDMIFEIGRILAPLRKQGVLLIGSGNLVNNKEAANLDDKYAEPSEWAIEIDEWFNDMLDGFEIEKLRNYKKYAPNVDKAIAEKSHILPLFFVLGAMMQNDHYVPLYDGFHYGNISMRSFAFASNY